MSRLRLIQFVNAVTRNVLKCFEGITRLLGPCLIVLALGLIGTVTVTYFDAMMPALGVEAFSFTWIIVTAFGIWLLLNILFNYTAAALLSPGHPAQPAQLSKVCGCGPEPSAAEPRGVSAHGLFGAAASLPAFEPDDRQWHLSWFASLAPCRLPQQPGLWAFLGAMTRPITARTPAAPGGACLMWKLAAGLRATTRTMMTKGPATVRRSGGHDSSHGARSAWAKSRHARTTATSATAACSRWTTTAHGMSSVVTRHQHCRMHVYGFADWWAHDVACAAYPQFLPARCYPFTAG